MFPFSPRTQLNINVKGKAYDTNVRYEALHLYQLNHNIIVFKALLLRLNQPSNMPFAIL